MSAFLNEIASYLDDEGVGNFETAAGRDIFVGKEPPLPNNCISILEPRGQLIGEARDVQSLHFPRFSVLVRNEDYDDGEAVVQEVRTALHGLINESLPNWRVLRCHAESEPEGLGDDDQGRFGFLINFVAETNAQVAS